jgi:DnaJ-class molecular chaperone
MTPAVLIFCRTLVGPTPVTEPRMAKRDLYDVLGISRSATADEIKKAHRKLVRQFHPDVNKNNPAATEKFKEVQEAYDILSDPAKRRNYDQFGHAGVGAGVGGTGGPGSDPFDAYRRARGGRGGTYQWQGSPGVTVEDFDPSEFGEGAFSDVFEQLFGGRSGRGGQGGRGAAGRQGRREPQRGADIEYPATLSFDQAARGTKLPLHLTKGSDSETIEVHIPPGVKDGSRVRIRGKGESSAGGESGDLFIITTISSHPYFVREGLDVILELPISLYEAILGTKVTVPTLDGPVTLTVPPKTNSGAKLRIKARGIFRGDEKGDQLVTIKIMVPRELDDDDRGEIEKLAKKHPFDVRADVKWR